MRMSVLAILVIVAVASAQRTFTIDYDNDQFLLDGKPWRYISGSVHYFRTHPDQWEARVKAVRAAGLNAIETYIAWNFHETYQGQVDFTSPWRNISRFFELAQQNDLKIILRPGPYICAEWENGGLPYWLLKYPNIKQRVNNADFVAAVESFWTKLFQNITPWLYRNGGPIILVQIENEYGALACDHDYTEKLRDIAWSVLGNETILFTSKFTPLCAKLLANMPSKVSCGNIPGVYTTVDFGTVGESAAIDNFKKQHEFTPNGRGPNVNSEYYPGWFSTWGGGTPGVPGASDIVRMTTLLWNLNASFNVYMWHGGTNFEFWNGAEDYAPLITSYDYFSPMNEAGDANEKYQAVASWIKTLPNWPNPPLDTPKPSTKMAYAVTPITKIGNFFDLRDVLEDTQRCVTADAALNFEALDQPYGFVHYQAILSKGGVTLDGTNIKDIAYVYVNKQYVGRITTHYKPETVTHLDINAKASDVLDIIVENRGRQNYLTINDYKGILGDVKLDGTVIKSWTSCPINHDLIGNISTTTSPNTKEFLPFDIYNGVFMASMFVDTYLDVSDWGKGFVYINGFNIGRYWSTKGPQKSLYIPAPLIEQRNTLRIVELEKVGKCNGDDTRRCTITFLDHPN